MHESNYNCDWSPLMHAHQCSRVQQHTACITAIRAKTQRLLLCLPTVQNDRVHVLTRTVYNDNTGIWQCQFNGRVFRDQCHSKWLSFLHHLIIGNADGDAYLIWSTTEGHRLRANCCVVIRCYIEWKKSKVCINVLHEYITGDHRVPWITSG